MRSNNTDIQRPKIELIVGHNGEKDLQPVVLGNNLVNYLQANNKILNTYNKILTNLIKRVMTNTTALVPLTFGIYGGQAVQHGVESLGDLSNITLKILNEMLNDFNYLDTGILPGKKSILSKDVFIT